MITLLIHSFESLEHFNMGKAWHYVGAVLVVVVGVWVATAIANPIAGLTAKTGA